MPELSAPTASGGLSEGPSSNVLLNSAPPTGSSPASTLTTWELVRQLRVYHYRTHPLDFARELLPHHFTRPMARLHEEWVRLAFRPRPRVTESGVSPIPSLPEGVPASARESQEIVSSRHEVLGAKVALAAPRNFAKSTLGSLLLPLWAVALKEAHFLCLISNTHAQAVKFLHTIKVELETNTALHQHFPTLKPNVGKWSENELEVTHGLDRMKLLALGAEAQLRGLKFLQYRPDLLILDDIEDDEMVRSEARRQHLQWWLDHVVLMTNPHARIVLLGTVLHEASLLHRIVTHPDPADQRLYGDWVTRKFQALEGGASTWPAFLTTQQLEDERARDPYGFAQERQNDPVAPDFCPFKPEYFSESRWWTQLPDDLTISITLDPACTDKEYSDETALCVAGWDPQGRLWVLEMVHGKYTNPSDILDLLFTAYDRWALQNPRLHPGQRFYCVGIEHIAFQKFLLHLFRQAARERHLHPFVKELKGDRDKTRRIWQLEPLFRENRIFLRPDLTPLEAQLKVFPNGQHDDQADALAYHLALGLTLPTRSPDPPTEGLTFSQYAKLHEDYRALTAYRPDLKGLVGASLVRDPRWN